MQIKVDIEQKAKTIERVAVSSFFSTTHLLIINCTRVLGDK